MWEEIVFIAYYLHWSFDTIANLDHRTRNRVLAEVTRINAELSGDHSTFRSDVTEAP